MITKKDISAFFDYEAESAKANWDTLMNLPVDERIRKRKAVKDVYLDKEEQGETPEYEPLLKLHASSNLSDFKEGEYLLLHKENSRTGIKCTLNSFEDDDVIMVSVYPPNLPSDLTPYYDVPLVIDKDMVDLRQPIYDKFTMQLPVDPPFWKKAIFNNTRTPKFENLSKCRKNLEDTIKVLDISLTDNQKEAVLKSMAAKDYYLIQGPPGTGKSFVLSLVILEEMADFEHKVIVVGPNHMAINNTLEAVAKLCNQFIGTIIKVGQSYYEPTIEVEIGNEKKRILNVQRASDCEFGDEPMTTYTGPMVVGMTSHALYSSRGRGMECDTLIIDEAGQMTIPLALMGMIKAKKVIFAGDHKQLPPIIGSDKISDEMRMSAFQKIMTTDNCTMLDISFRMCGPICDFVSKLFYEGKVTAKKSGKGDLVLCDDPLYSFDTPIVLHNVSHNGVQSSEEEAQYIVDVISGYLRKGLPSSEVAVLAPFRAQAALIRRLIRKSESIPDDDKKNIAVDTVDKMQGQEREVIIYSMTAGDFAYMTEMGEFLYNPNKLNVAFSRAKSKLIIVGNVEKMKNLSADEYKHIHDMIAYDGIAVL